MKSPTSPGTLSARYSFQSWKISGERRPDQHPSPRLGQTKKVHGTGRGELKGARNIGNKIYRPMGWQKGRLLFFRGGIASRRRGRQEGMRRRTLGSRGLFDSLDLRSSFNNREGNRTPARPLT